MGFQAQATVLTLGIFDGVHLGHQELLKQAKTLAGIHGAACVAVTFDPHPQRVLRPDMAPKLLQSLHDRTRCLVEFGADSVHVVPFTRDLSDLDPLHFLDQVLIGQLGAVCIVVGRDYRFGRNRAGDVSTIEVYGKENNIGVHIVDEVQVDGISARSTIIRNLLTTSNVQMANRLLGRDWTVRGIVVRGRQLGRTLGWPTANIALDESLLYPGPGIYAGWCDGDFGRRIAAISIGTNPTVAHHLPVSVEAYLIDFDGDLYGRQITLGITAWIRSMETFPDLETLKCRIAEDVLVAKQLAGPALCKNGDDNG